MVRKSLLRRRPGGVHQHAPVTKFLAKEGDRVRGSCEHCRGGVDAHLVVRTYPMPQSGIDVPGVLVYVCDWCGNIVATPAQSAARLYEARQARKEEQLEARIPTHLEDIIYLLAREFFTSVQAFRPAVLRFYLGELLNDASLAGRVRELAASDLADAPARARVSLRVPAELLAAVREQARAAGIAKDSDLIRGLLLAAKEDVLDGRHEERILRLSGAAQAGGAYRAPSPYILREGPPFIPGSKPTE
jgi:hypothetical protein